MKTALLYAVSAILFAATILVNLYHLGTIAKPEITNQNAEAIWHDHEEYGIHHLILKGPPFGRGVEAGKLTRELLEKQEEALHVALKTWLPEEWMIQAMLLGAFTWFNGIEKYFSPARLEEMYGTSLSASRKYDFLAEPYTRQIAYHAVHEVGQMMVDAGGVDEGMACTVVAVPRGRKWIVGRNFDFEGGRIFDKEKIVKWVYPEEGNPFVSIIWAGMVGGVTGVNMKGLYVSINAAGSDDFARLGTPSTMILLDILQYANTTDEAVAILGKSQMFITDIFVIADAHGHLVRVEKSPLRMSTIPLAGPTVVTNHLIGPEFAKDPTNARRRDELTSLARQKRGDELAAKIEIGFDLDQTLSHVLGILRDKGVNDRGQTLPLGHRHAIDALIATHSVIYDGERNVLYVSEGPALAGPFRGYDLTRSFAFGKPIEVDSLPRDPLVSDEKFELVTAARLTIAKAHKKIRGGDCREGQSLLDSIPAELREQSPYYFALGDAQKCYFEDTEARKSWQRALELKPAYTRHRRELTERLKR